MSWEYTSDTADVWEIHTLCNHFAAKGWEPVMMSAIPSDKVDLPARIDDDVGPRRPGRPVAPHVILFRRAVFKEHHYLR
jgi:hypothetical protein